MIVTVLVVSVLVDWTLLGRQDPARAIGFGPVGVESLGTYRFRPVFNAGLYVAFVGVGVLFVLCGLLARHGKAPGHTAALLWGCGLVWLLGGLRLSSYPWAFTLGAVITLYYMPMLIHVGLGLPGGRLPTVSRRRFVAGCYVFFLGVPVVTWPLFDPRLHVSSGSSTSVNLLLIRDEPGTLRLLGYAEGAGYILVGLIGFVWLTTLWIRGTAPSRRAFTPLWLAFLVMAVAKTAFTFLAGLAFNQMQNPGNFLTWATMTIPFWATGLIPLGVLVSLSRFRGDRGASTRLIVSATAMDPDDLETLVRQTLHDPAAELWSWSEEDRCYLASDGTHRDPQTVSGSQTVTVIERSGTVLGALVHDQALLQQPAMVDTVCATAGLVLHNLRLAESLRDQLGDARRSRQRIVTAADDERRRLERNIHDGTQQQLLAAALTFTQAHRATDPLFADQMFTEGSALLGQAITDLRELVRGLHPPILRDRGLPAALRALAERGPLPVSVADTFGQRTSEQLEACLYFTASEAVTNAVKHSGATHVDIELFSSGRDLVLTVTDDGRGGSVIQPGGGLAGLQDRLVALGGSLTLITGAGGTTVTGRLPLLENGTLV